MTDYIEYAPSAEYLHLLSAPIWPARARPEMRADLRGALAGG
ncbi:hypothetical protein AB0M34_21045 [Nocardia sp. NPDC050193]